MKAQALKLALVLLIALAFGVPQVRAATVLDQEYLVTNGTLTGFTQANGSGFRRAETFTVGVAGTLSEVDVFTPGALTFTGLNILSTVGGVPTTTVVGSGSFVSDTAGDAVFDTTLAVSVGEVLAIEPTVSLATNFLQWQANVPNTYPGGADFVLNPAIGTSFFKGTAGDDFRTFVTTTTTTTPLPAALPLFASGLGALGLLGWRRKRKQAVA